MKVVIRKYSGKGAKELVDVLQQKAAEAESVMRTVRGFVNYTLARTADGGVAVMICQDQAGIDESVQKAKAWIAQHAAHTGVGAPAVTVGDVVWHLK